MTCETCYGLGEVEKFVGTEPYLSPCPDCCDHDWDSVNDMKRFVRITTCLICGKVKDEEEDQ